MSVRERMINRIGTSIQVELPGFLAQSLEEEASATTSELSQRALIVLADYARTSGTAGLYELTGLIVDTLRDNDNGVSMVQLASKFSALHLTDLVDQLQSAEAEEKQRSAELFKTIGDLVLNIGEILIDSVVKNLTENII